MADQLSDLYRDILMEHYRFPRGKKDLPRADISNEGHNPTCGDDIEIKVSLDGDKVKDVSVNCAGCAISVASGSMLAEIIEGKSIDEVKKIARVVKALLKGEAIEEEIELGDLEALRGVRKFPVRIKCALLSWTTLIDALEARDSGQRQEYSSTEEAKTE
jgi:nitrogen fixation NifU-like protein